MSKQPDCSECEKLSATTSQSEPIGEFLEWLDWERGLTICELGDEGYVPSHISINDLLAEYFKIDLNKVEQERQALLEWIRTQ